MHFVRKIWMLALWLSGVIVAKFEQFVRATPR